jgi:hypothetical protein
MRSSVTDIHRQIAALRLALRAPTVELLEDQVPALTVAVEQIARLTTQQPNSMSASELMALKAELRAATRLIEHGMMLNQAWAALLASTNGCYESGGEPRPLAVSSTISVQG